MVAEVPFIGGVAPQPEGRDVRALGRVQRASPEHGHKETISSVSRPEFADRADRADRDPGRKPRQANSQTVTEIRDVAQRLFRDLQFSVDEDSGDVVVKVVDRGTGEVLRQIPSKELMELGRALSGLQADRERALEEGLDRGAGSGSPSLAGVLISTKV